VSTAQIVAVTPVDARLSEVTVGSSAMSRVRVLVLRPDDRGRSHPTLYLLDGRSAFPDGSSWLTRGRVEQFFADKPVNVVFTTGGRAGYYTDWQRPDPVLGTYRWETFLTKELPPLIDRRFGGNGRDAVAGVSMGAQAALMLAVRAPWRYRGVAGYSGCYSSTGDIGEGQMRGVVASFGGDPDAMFGPPGDPDWAAHDVVGHAEALRGKDVLLSAGSGVPGRHETAATPGVADAVALGGPLEALTNLCTRRLAARLAELGIPATLDLPATGTHSWPYWADELPRSWPVLAHALGVTG
jgi:S-formylglutathione hydrolase FrmB